MCKEEDKIISVHNFYSPFSLNTKSNDLIVFRFLLFYSASSVLFRLVDGSCARTSKLYHLCKQSFYSEFNVDDDGGIEGSAKLISYAFKMVSGSLSDRLGKRKIFVPARHGLSTISKPFFAVSIDGLMLFW